MLLYQGIMGQPLQEGRWGRCFGNTGEVLSTQFIVLWCQETWSSQAHKS
jgi:hypothetical protein